MDQNKLKWVKVKRNIKSFRASLPLSNEYFMMYTWVSDLAGEKLRKSVKIL